MKTCNICFTEKDLVEFYKNGPRFRPECKACTDIKQAAARFGITVEILFKMYEEQEFKCAICRRECKSYRNLSIDHDHRCCPEKGRSCGKCVRGLLCASCNHGLGFFGDDWKVLEKAMDYLK